MGISVDVTTDNFEAAVLAASFDQPVVVDFFATWCGPCQMLKPMLEKLVQEYDFVLAKVDIDRNPELANAYGVEGVPDVRVVTAGQVQPGFVGVLPEPQIRDLLAQLGLKSSLDKALETLAVAEATGDPSDVEALLSELTAAFPDNRDLLLRAAQFFVQQNRLDQAQALLDQIQPHERGVGDRAEGLKGLIEFKQISQAMMVETPQDQAYLAACRAAVEGEYDAALTELLALVAQDRSYRNDAARKGMIALFKLLGDDHPLTVAYRKRLMQALY